MKMKTIYQMMKLMTDQNFFKKEYNNTAASKDNYLKVIKLIEDLEGKNIIYFSRYLKALDFFIQKVLINEYLEYDFENEENILQSILRVINVLYDKDTFHCIYNKFSEIYRRHKDISPLDSIKKFNKLMKVWELLYNVEPFTTNIKEIGSILLLPQIEKDDPNGSIYFEFNDFNFQSFEIQIKFFPSFLLKLNLYDENSYIINISYNNNTKTTIRYKHFKEKVENLIKTFNFKYEIKDGKQNYFIVINDIKTQIIEIESPIKKIELLNKFYGEIESVTIKVNNGKEMHKNIIKNVIRKDGHKKISYTIPIEKKKKEKKEKKETKESFNYGGKIFSEKYEDSNNKYFKVKPKNLNKLKHFGNINSFIPLYKIINYIINEEGNSMENNTNKEEKISNLKNVLANVSKILRTTVKILFLSGIEFENFFAKKLYIPLIGALSEILESVNKIKDDEEKKELEKYLLDDEIFFILYIILLNSFASENIKNTYKSLFITQNYLDKQTLFKILYLT